MGNNAHIQSIFNIPFIIISIVFYTRDNNNSNVLNIEKDGTICLKLAFINAKSKNNILGFT